MKLSPEKSIALLSEIIELSNATIDIDSRLISILEIILSSFGFKDIALYVMDVETSMLSLKASPYKLFKKEIPLDIDPIVRVVNERQNCVIEKNHDEKEFLSQISGDLSAVEGAIFPISDQKFFYGSLIITLHEGSQLTEGDLTLIAPICREIAGTMRNAQLYSNSREMVEYLLTLNDVWKTVNSTIELDSLMDITISKVASALKASCGIINLHETPNRDSSSFFYNLHNEKIKAFLISQCEDLGSGRKIESEAMLLEGPFKNKEGEYVSLQGPGDKLLIAPLTYGDKDLGSISLFSKVGAERFGEKDLQLFSTVASQISAVINNALLMDRMALLNLEKEQVYRELANLFELNKAVMATINLDKLLHIILTAVTVGDGFGFNRAMLFLFNEKSGYIQGMTGVGPDSSEEAWKIWSEINEKRKTLHEILEDGTHNAPRSELNNLVKSIRVSVNDKSILGLTVRNKSPYNIADAKNDERVNLDLLSKLNCHAFATAPLMAAGRVVGVILVDNIYNRRPISDNDIRLLTIFANQAGVAIDNSILYRNLEETHLELKKAQSKLVHSEKLAALGEMSAGVAHEIRNPLVSIGGFARRLARTVEEKEGKKYVDIICKEVERLENILNEILVFSRDEPIEVELQDINKVIDDTLQFFWNDYKNNNITVSKDLQGDAGLVEANYHQLKQVFINLFSNARHAMPESGLLKIKSYQTDYEDDKFVIVEISDTGGGIPYDVMTNIFNPFFTTKNEGTGLGLAITHKILTSCKGDIEVINNDEGGATFIIKLPVSIVT
ncbi:MAG: GAF domain-containing protein [bacterium]|nr:GAF domain-containing protein [bacterium]